MHIPCEYKWCVALAVEGKTRCAVHEKQPGLRPLTRRHAVEKNIERLYAGAERFRSKSGLTYEENKPTFEQDIDAIATYIDEPKGE